MKSDLPRFLTREIHSKLEFFRNNFHSLCVTIFKKINKSFSNRYIGRGRTLNWCCLNSKSAPPVDWELYCIPNPKGFAVCFWCELFCAPNAGTLDLCCCCCTWRNLHLSPYWQLKDESHELKIIFKTNPVSRKQALLILWLYSSNRW